MKKMKLKTLKTLAAILLIAVVMSLASCAQAEIPKPAEDNGTIDAILSNFETVDLDGNVVTQEVFKQYDIIVLNVWGTFCGPCLREMPDLGVLAQEYASQKLAIVGLVSDTVDYWGNLDSSQVDLARDIVESTGADYLHLLPSSDDDLSLLLQGVQYLPTTFFLTSGGVPLRVEEVGSKSINEWREIFDQLLAK